MRNGIRAGALAGAAMMALASSQAAASDKSRYSLLDPTPDGKLRDMSTDRPDKTESPYTVDAGRFQIETDLVAYTHDRRDGITTRAFDVMPFNLKIGLTDSSDLQLVYGAFSHVRTSGHGVSETERGFGDLVVRYKQNLWGNDGGATAFGLIPYVTLLTESEPEIEAGLLAPLAIAGPGGWGFGVMLELDAVRREAGHALELLASATAARAVWRDLGAFFELASTLPLDAEDLAMSGNTGLTLALSGDVVLDAGVRVGLTEAAEDLVVFVGGSARY